MTRAYDASARQEAARATRRRILDTAIELLLEGGYAAMTIAELARAAGVSAQTVYNSIGGKAEVVKAAWDVLLAGDDEAVAMSDRPEFLDIVHAADPDAWAEAYAGWCRGICDRVGVLVGRLLRHGSAGDTVLEEFLATIEAERRRGAANSLEGLARRGVIADPTTHQHVVDAVWALTGPELYDRLVARSGWTAAEYERWLAHHLRAAVDLDRPAPRL